MRAITASKPSEQGFILMILVLVLLIVGAAGFAFFRIHHKGVTIPATPLTTEHTYGAE